MQVEAYSERPCKLVVKCHRLRGWLAGFLSATLHQVIFYSQNVNSAQQLPFISTIIDCLDMLFADVTGSLLFMATFSTIAEKLHRRMTR